MGKVISVMRAFFRRSRERKNSTTSDNQNALTMEPSVINNKLREPANEPQAILELDSYEETTIIDETVVVESIGTSINAHKNSIQSEIGNQENLLCYKLREPANKPQAILESDSREETAIIDETVVVVGTSNNAHRNSIQSGTGARRSAENIHYNDELTNHLPFLCENMESSEIITYLQSRKVLTFREAEQLRTEKISYDRNYLMITLIKRKGPEALRYFLESLEKTKQQNLAERIQKENQRSASFDHYEAQTCRNSLIEIYLDIFRIVNPFSLPFTFDIENTWVSLALREDSARSTETEDHAELLKTAFSKAEMMIIEGEPATGKTSLMRRIAFEWAKGKQELAHYDLVVYGEFRAIREQKFKTIAELIQSCLMAKLTREDSEELVHLLTDKGYCKTHSVLVLLDGYDESSLDNQCDELQKFLNASTVDKLLLFDIVLTTRPGYLTVHRGQERRFVFADVLGFTTEKQKRKYILNHFSTKEGKDSIANIRGVQELLQSNEDLAKLSQTPLFLTFICLVHERIFDGTLLELYLNIIWWLLDRHQKEFPDRDVPSLFGLQRKYDGDNFQIIQDNFLKFAQLHFLGDMALKNTEISVFTSLDLFDYKLNKICEQVGLLRKEENRDKSFRRIVYFCFPHRTIQEFLAALSFFFSDQMNRDIDENLYKIFTKDIAHHLPMKELEKFLWRIVLSNELHIIQARRLDFFDKFTSLVLDFDFFCSEGANITVKQLNSCLLHCLNVTQLCLYSSSRSLPFCESVNLTNMTKLKEFYLNGEVKGVKGGAGLSFSSENTVEHENYKKSFVLLPSNSDISIHFSSIYFISAKLFSESMEYFLNVLKHESQICLDVIEVFGDEDTNSSFIVDISKALSSIVPETTFPKIFADQELNNALRYVSCASVLLINEFRLVPYNLSFEIFSELEDLYLLKATFLAGSLLTLNKCSNLRRLIFEKCKIDLIAWRIITKEITNSAIRRLELSLDNPFFETEFSEFFGYLKDCELIEELLIDSLDVDRVVWDSVEAQLISIILNKVAQMKNLKNIHFKGKFKEYSMETREIKQALEEKMITVTFSFNSN